MGVKKKHVPGCSCCQVCTYEASDGNEHTNDFSSSLSGWAGIGLAGSLSSGRLVLTSAGMGAYAGQGRYHRSYPYPAPSNANLKLIVESNFWEGADIAVHDGWGLFIADFRMLWLPTLSNYFLEWYDGTTKLTQNVLGPGFVDGDKLSMIVYQYDGTGNKWCVIWAVNGTVINDETNLDTSPKFTDPGPPGDIYGYHIYQNYAVDGLEMAQADNFTAHRGNP